ncbi:MAG: VOC family protein [Proteobacteria bacterium]|nr:VOC family protein [Pseudomonadota bacterium]
MGDRDEFYLRPILCVRDVSASAEYFCEKLGFERSWQSPDDEPIIAQVGRNGLDLILDSKSSIPRARTPSVLSMSLHDADALGTLYEEFSSRGAATNGPPCEVPWQQGVFQFEVQDLDGNILVFWGDKPR